MNCFSISVYLSNHIFHDTHDVFGVFLTSALVIVVLYYMLIFTHQKYLIVDSIVSSVSLQMSLCCDHVGSFQSTHLSQLSQPFTTFLSLLSPSVLVLLLGQFFCIFCPHVALLFLVEVVLRFYTRRLLAAICCWLGMDSLYRCLICYAFIQFVRWLYFAIVLVWTLYVVVLCVTLLHKSSIFV